MAWLRPSITRPKLVAWSLVIAFAIEFLQLYQAPWMQALRANKLVEVEEIMQISSRLVVNQAALKLKQAPLKRIIDVFAQAIQQD